jgi:catechol 2,3-dioxygenase-like lactoylglutathione lyase family enzyme
MPLKKLTPSLYSRDIENQAEFYRDLLGFALVGLYVEQGCPRWCHLERDGVGVMFALPPEREEAALKAPRLSGQLYIEVEDLDAEIQRLHGHVPFEWGPEVMPYGMRELSFRDPEGYRITLAEATADELDPSEQGAACDEGVEDA